MKGTDLALVLGGLLVQAVDCEVLDHGVGPGTAVRGAVLVDEEEQEEQLRARDRNLRPATRCVSLARARARVAQREKRGTWSAAKVRRVQQEQGPAEAGRAAAGPERGARRRQRGSGAQ